MEVLQAHIFHGATVWLSMLIMQGARNSVRISVLDKNPSMCCLCHTAHNNTQLVVGVSRGKGLTITAISSFFFNMFIIAISVS